MDTMITRRMPIVFAVSAAHAPALEVARDAAGIVVVAVHTFERRGVVANVGAHILSPAWLPVTPLEERVVEALRRDGVETQRVPSMVPLPSGLSGNAVPVVVLTLDAGLSLARLEAVGRSLRPLRDDRVVLAGIAQESDMLAVVSLLVGAAYEDDRIVELGARGGFVLVPETHDVVDDEGCCFWDVEAAGELPHEVIEQLRPFLGENHDVMSRKTAPPIRITRFDKTRLLRLLQSLDAQQHRDEIEGLERELERGTEVESTEIEPDVVTMNSSVRVTDLDTNATHLYTIVFPAEADFDKGRISILSPLGTALLGSRAGEVVTWEMPRGTRRVRVEELLYQPEAAGDFHL